jgi:hypothetical protein
VTNDEARLRILVQGNGRALGISEMYPTTVGGIRQLQGRLPDYRFPEAERVVSTLLTLPTHGCLTVSDRAAICALVNRVDARTPVSRAKVS